MLTQIWLKKPAVIKNYKLKVGLSTYETNAINFRSSNSVSFVAKYKCSKEHTHLSLMSRKYSDEHSN